MKKGRNIIAVVFALAGLVCSICSCEREDEDLIGECYIMQNNQRITDTLYYNETNTSVTFNVDERDLQGNTEYAEFEWNTYYRDGENGYISGKNVDEIAGGRDKNYVIRFRQYGTYKVECLMYYHNDTYTKTFHKSIYVIVE